MAINFVLFSFGWGLQHPQSKTRDDYSARRGRGRENGSGAGSEEDMHQGLLSSYPRGESQQEEEEGFHSGGEHNRSRSRSHSHGRCVSIDYDSDSHQENIEKLRCNSTGGFV